MARPYQAWASRPFTFDFCKTPIAPPWSELCAAFHEHSSGGPTGAQGFYSFVVKPSDEGAETHFVTDDVFVLVTVRGGGNHGQTLCFVRYRRL